MREHLRALAPYTPIEPFEVLSARLGRDPAAIVKLDANENPYGPPPEVTQALGAMRFPHIYPDPETRRLRARLAADLGVPAEQVLVRDKRGGFRWRHWEFGGEWAGPSLPRRRRRWPCSPRHRPRICHRQSW